ncbi:MAG: HypC/HybG/HupF family hydrogenase formation chaperone [Sulfurimonas sp.]|jgi:hydrogenase expression/formation protein HypC|nr:HypC/HybG/HupF family hydrogenase formation chaperone [Sulfurimonas sp.]
MCLSIPSKITKIDKEKKVAQIDTMGVVREASLALMDETALDVGDFVLIHVGFVMQKIDKEEALLSLEAFEEILLRMDEDEVKSGA